MSIKQEADGTWTAKYSKRHPVTRQPVSLVRTGFKSRVLADRAEKELVVKLNERFKRETTPTWKDCVEAFLAASRDRGLAIQTLYGYETCLRAHTMEAFGTRLIDSITTEEVRRVLQEKAGKRSQSHQKYLLKVIRHVFGYAAEKGWIARNPTPLVKFKVGDKMRSVLSESQARLLLAKAAELGWEWHPHYALALYTGMRNGELYALTKDKVDIEKRLIKVDCSWNNKDGFKSTKSGHERLIEIAPALLPLLKRLMQENPDSFFVLPRNPRWDKGEQARELRMLLVSIGLPQIRFHDLRATWATILLNKGVAPVAVMKMGGWRSMETMMLYIRKAGIDIRGATERLDFGTASDGAETNVRSISPGSVL